MLFLGKLKKKNKVADLTKFSECPENWSKSPMILSKWHITDMGWKYPVMCTYNELKNYQALSVSKVFEDQLGTSNYSYQKNIAEYQKF